MSSPAAGPIGRVISFAGIDEPVRATAANVTSGELRAHHVGLSEAMVTTVPVRVAPMLVLRLAADLGGHDVSTVDVMQATTSVVAGLGVWDGGSAALLRLVLGRGISRPDDVDLQLLGVLVDKGGQQVATSCGRATLGHPAAAVAALASPWGGRLGEALAAGWLVAAGPMTPYIIVAPGEHGWPPSLISARCRWRRWLPLSPRRAGPASKREPKRPPWPGARRTPSEGSSSPRGGTGRWVR